MVTRKTFTDPIVGALRALGVTYANPPPGQTDMAGMNFDDTGQPLNLQNHLGTLVPFPGAGLIGTGQVIFTAGVPGAGVGNNGDIAINQSSTGVANTTIYQKRTGAWVGIV